MALRNISLLTRPFHRGLSKKEKGKSSVTRFLLIFLLAFFACSVRVYALNDGIIPRLFGFRRRVAFTSPGTSKQRFGLESVAVDRIPADGRPPLSKLRIITNLAKDSHSRINRTSNQKTNSNRKHSSRSPDPPRIIIIGGPASGKGTQCEYIAERYGVVHLSTGDMLREAVRSGTAIGKVAKEFMDRGELVPDNVMINIVGERLDQEDCQQQGWLLDGFPRTKVQAAHLHDLGIVPDLILFLDVPDDLLIERVTGRRLDPQTGKIYHLSFCPPPTDIIDRLEQRSDDTAEKAERRLEHFHSNLSEIRAYLGDAIVEVDGTRSPSIVSKSMAKIIDNKTKKRRAKA